MGQITVIPSQTAAVATKTQVNATAYKWVLLTADNLATTETVPIFFESGTTWVALADESGNPVTLTADITSLQLDGGIQYAVTKDETAGACGVYFNTGPGIEQ